MNSTLCTPNAALPKTKFPLSVARSVAEKLLTALRPACARIVIAGSIRRQRPQVGDIEILYIPLFTEVPNPQSLFGDETMRVNAVDLLLAALIQRGSLEKRLNVNGAETWGPSNKFARAVKTGIPVDLFTATEKNWWNYLVCRTGPAELNVQICNAAIAKGYQWRPTAYGFERKFATTKEGEVERVIINSEREVFAFAGLPYKEPHER